MELEYKRSFSVLLDLPVEIFQQVTSFLEPSDLTCLGLTCKGLWSYVVKDTIKAFRTNNVYWLRQRESLLIKLAKDSPNMIFCYICLNLQRLHGSRQLTVSNQWIRPPCQHLATHISICEHFSITREMLELALKSEKTHQPELQASDPFAHKCNWRTSGTCSGEFSLEMRSKVVEREIHLKITYDVGVKVNVKGAFNVPSMRGKGCLHSGMWLKKRCACALRHAVNGELPCAGCSRPQRCAYCFTHFLVSANKKRTGSLNLQVRAYRYLGGGQAGGAGSERAWEAQIRMLSLARQHGVYFHANDCSLEDVFEHGRSSKFLGLSPRRKKRDPHRSFREHARSLDTPWPEPWQFL
jgi:hypothetical protein